MKNNIIHINIIYVLLYILHILKDARFLLLYRKIHNFFFLVSNIVSEFIFIFYCS